MPMVMLQRKNKGRLRIASFPRDFAVLKDALHSENGTIRHQHSDMVHFDVIQLADS